MAEVQHKDLDDTELHEPKGILSAALDSVYKSNGSGSGVWEKVAANEVTVSDAESLFTASQVEAVLSEIYKKLKGGWGFYQDNGSVGQSVGTTAVKLSNNALGNTLTDELPDGVDDLWDSTNNLITPGAANDVYNMRLDLPVTAKTGSPSELLVELDLGGTASPSIVILERRISITNTPPYTLSVAFPIFAGATFVANGAQIFLTTDTGTATITAPQVFLTKVYSGE